MIGIRHGIFYLQDHPKIHFILLIYKMEIFLLNNKALFQVLNSGLKINMVFLNCFHSHLIDGQIFKVRFLDHFNSEVKGNLLSIYSKFQNIYF